MSRLFGLVLALAMVPVACESAPPAPPENVLGGADMTEVGGCGDAFVWVTNSDSTIALTVNWAEAASRAQADGQLQETATLPDEQVTVTIQFGQHLADGFCTDVLMPDRPRIVAEAPASSGEAEITVLAAPGAEPFMPLASAGVSLSDLVFEVPVEGSFETWRIESLDIPDVQVGWLAG